MPNISVSRGQWDQIPRFVARRRPGGGAPDRLDTTSTSPATELDIALGFTIHNDHHDDDDDFSIGSPSVATAVTANISPVTPDDDNRRPPPLEDDGRGGRDRTDHGSGRDTRRRRHRGKNIARREPPPPRFTASCHGRGESADQGRDQGIDAGCHGFRPADIHDRATIRTRRERRREGDSTGCEGLHYREGRDIAVQLRSC